MMSPANVLSHVYSYPGLMRLRGCKLDTFVPSVFTFPGRLQAQERKPVCEAAAAHTYLNVYGRNTCREFPAASLQTVVRAQCRKHRSSTTCPAPALGDSPTGLGSRSIGIYLAAYVSPFQKPPKASEGHWLAPC